MGSNATFRPYVVSSVCRPSLSSCTFYFLPGMTASPSKLTYFPLCYMMSCLLPSCLLCNFPPTTHSPFCSTCLFLCQTLSHFIYIALFIQFNVIQSADVGQSAASWMYSCSDFVCSNCPVALIVVHVLNLTLNLFPHSHTLQNKQASITWHIPQLHFNFRIEVERRLNYVFE